jgi:hypothetical protein
MRKACDQDKYFEFRCADAQRFFCLRCDRRCGQIGLPIVTFMAKNLRHLAVAALLLCCGLSAVFLSGCADAYYVDTIHTPEARYNTDYGPYYYPYYPWYGYYGGAYYNGDVSR